MAYLVRCRVARKVSGLSRIIGESNSVLFGGQRSLQNGVRKYSSLIDNVKKSGILAVKPLTQHSKKIPLNPFVNQLRASSSGDHVKLWQFERIVSAAFIFLLPGCLLLENPIVDVAFSTLLVMHAHWGLEAVILDYVRPAIVGPLLPKIAMGSLYVMSAVTLAGLIALVFNGPGIGGAVKKFWAIRKN